MSAPLHRAERREVEARLYMQLAEQADTRAISEAEVYLLEYLQRRLRAFREAWFKGEQQSEVRPASTPYLVADLDPAHIPPLEEVMDAMERAGWSFRITSRVENGHRIYSARAWRDEESGGSTPACRDPFPKVALAGAWVEMERQYRSRRNRDARQVHA
ncbi:hypothetical protein ACFSR9_11925 [Deinococcus taklimakanensis]|uniref:Uncharacterized protein n=1 Tax=Deinococcus taklimakanensis TaxID=536443 RepID=A0ABW5P4N1_9DEIO